MKYAITPRFSWSLVGIAPAALLALSGCSVTTNAPDASSNDNASSSGSSSGGGTQDEGGSTADDGGASAQDGAATTDTQATDADASDGAAPGTVEGGGPTQGDGSSNDALASLVTPEAGCIADIYGTYVVRKDGLAVHEGPPEQVVIDDTSGTTNTPLANVLTVQQDNYAACAIVAGGGVKCWQEDATNGNTYGQLGNGTTTPVAVYRAVSVLTAAGTPLANAVSLASGINSNAACAVTTDAELWCWGNLTWLANDGSQDYASYAQRITADGQSPLTGVLQATLGYTQACALLAGSPNQVWCWGTDRLEELGQGNGKNQQYPVQVQGLTSPEKVVMAWCDNNNGYGPNTDVACELDGDSVLCWGSNDDGATGASPGVNPVPAPTLVVTSTMSVLRGVTDLEEGTDGLGVLRNDGTIWLWGSPDGNTAYAKSYGVTNVVQLGIAGGAGWPLRYLTNDGVYHTGMTAVNVNCGAFQ